MAKDVFELEIRNWSKYNGRRDIKSPTWFRLQNSIFEDPEFFLLSDQEKLLWLFLLCQASKRQSEIIKVNNQLFAAILSTSTDNIYLSLENLIKKDFVRSCHAPEENLSKTGPVRGRNADVTSAYATDKHTNKHITSDLEKNISSTWNQMVIGQPFLKPIRSLTPSRKKKIKTRLGEFPEFSDWQKVIENVKASDFLSGRSGNWVCTFNWVIDSDDNFLKILEGSYCNTKKIEPKHKAPWER